MNRDEIIEAVDAERDTQDAAHGGPEHDAALTPNDWIAILSRQLGLAASDGGAFDPARFRRQMVRVAATAFAALETVFPPVAGKVAGHVSDPWRTGV